VTTSLAQRHHLAQSSTTSNAASDAPAAQRTPPAAELLRAVAVVTLAEDDVSAMANAAASERWQVVGPAQEDMLAVRSSLLRQLEHVESMLRTAA